ncbi:MAG: LuxR C-terminal-related transcriptional regulator [Oleibacter sp.]|nr:LuxR C-terminal-related transcriptional regulator [Thalassolituus sp.]
MDSEANKKARHIIFYGHYCVQNSMLSMHIQRRTGIKCTLSARYEWMPEWFSTYEHVVVLVDANFVRRDPLMGLIQEIYRSKKNIPMAFFNLSEGHFLEKMIHWAQVNGFFYQSTDQDDLCDGIEQLFGGSLCFPKHLTNDFISRVRERPVDDVITINSLTMRELEIMNMVVKGATNLEISTRLSVSENTVKSHIYNVFRKIGVRTRTQAMSWAQEHIKSHCSSLDTTR